MTDPIAERVRKIGGMTLRSIGQISKMQRIKDNDAEFVEPLDMLAELCQDNQLLTCSRTAKAHMLSVMKITISLPQALIENWIDETGKRRTWFLFEACRRAETSGH